MIFPEFVEAISRVIDKISPSPPGENNVSISNFSILGRLAITKETRSTFGS